MNPTNQDGAIALWRIDAAKDDPPLYTVKEKLDRQFVWLNVGGNIGWYAPEIKDGEMVGIRSIAYPQPREGESPEDYIALNFAFKLISPKQRRKIEALLKTQ